MNGGAGNSGAADALGGRVGEVVAASTTAFTAQCYRLYEAPALGRLVRCGEDAPTYGVVYDAATESVDPSRHAIPRGIDAATEADALAANPQLERLLHTRFSAVIVGHLDGGGAVMRRLPPYAPRMYAFVAECGDGELRDFCASLEFLPTLLAAPTAAQDEVAAAFLRHAAAAHPNPRDFLGGAGKELAAALAGQLPRVTAILGRLL